jgi:siroheme synthase-like protein
MENYPIYLNIQHFKCLVVGGGKVACRKVNNLVEIGAKPLIISRNMCDELTELVLLHGLEILARAYEPEDMHGFQLIIAATNDKVLNDEIAQQAIDLKLLVNNVTNAALCTFQMPAVIRREGLEIAIGTGGELPYLSHRLKKYLEEHFTADKFEGLLEIYAKRKEVIAKTQGEITCRKEAFDAELAPLVDEFIQKLFS